jgi:hypothetical protein
MAALGAEEQETLMKRVLTLHIEVAKLEPGTPRT